MEAESAKATAGSVPNLGLDRLTLSAVAGAVLVRVDRVHLEVLAVDRGFLVASVAVLQIKDFRVLPLTAAAVVAVVP